VTEQFLNKEQFPNRRFQVDILCREDAYNQIANLKPWQYGGPDIVALTDGQITHAEAVTKQKFEGHRANQDRQLSFATTLHATEKGLECEVGRKRVVLVEAAALGSVHGFYEMVKKSNEAAAIALPEGLEDVETVDVRAMSLNENRFKTVDLAQMEGITRQAMDKRIKRLARDGWLDPSILAGPNQKQSFDYRTADIIRRNPRGNKIN
jgi:hypothetical protein